MYVCVCVYVCVCTHSYSKSERPTEQASAIHRSNFCRALQQAVSKCDVHRRSFHRIRPRQRQPLWFGFVVVVVVVIVIIVQSQ